MNPPQTTELNDGLEVSFTADQPEVQTAGKSSRPTLTRSQLNRQEFSKEMFDLN